MTNPDDSTWIPISRDNLLLEIASGLPQHNPTAKRLWDMIRIAPEKWQLHPWGDLGGGFWVVGLIGRSVVWYNDIEDGFNVSQWTRHGLIDDYFCDKCELIYVLANLVNHLVDGAPSPPKLGPPRNVVLDPDRK